MHQVRASLWAFLGFITLVAGCSDGEAELGEILRPVRCEKVFQSGGGRVRAFAGVARAGQEIVLSFKVSGTVETLAVSVGDRVAAGALIATLDDNDYRLETEESEASLRKTEAELRNARASYERVEALFEASNAALSELDQARAAFETAQAGVRSAENGLALARRRLGYTRLTAPVDGAIASCMVEASENVGSGQQVALLTAGERPEVTIDLPSQLIRQLSVGAVAEVVVGSLDDRILPARIIELGVAATGGSTVPVTVRLDDGDSDVLPGMSAEVRFSFGADDSAPRYFVPPSAVGEDMHGRYVFVVAAGDDGVGVARRVEVATGELTNQGLEITAGLADGDLLVTAGVSRLLDGTRVKLPQRTEP